MAFNAFLSPVTGWIAEWQGWPSQRIAPSPGELLRRIDVLITEVVQQRTDITQGKWVHGNYLQELGKAAQYCLADVGDLVRTELTEIASLDFSAPEGLAKFRVFVEGAYSPPDDPEYHRLQAEFDAKATAEAERFERVLRRARDKMRGTAPAAANTPGPAQDAQQPQSAAASQFRAQQVAQVIRELNVIKPQLFVPSDYARLLQEHPDYLTFRVTQVNTDLQNRLLNIKAHRQHILLAQQIVAANSGKALETIKIDWNRHKPAEFRHRPKS